MKKYVKPIMESEVFVANEYISNCWIVQCLNSNQYFITKVKPNPDIVDADGDGYTIGYLNLERAYYYDNRGKEFTCDHGNNKWYAHRITYFEINEDNHTQYNCGPNAS